VREREGERERGFVDHISSKAEVLRDFTYGGKRWDIA
jgi:hypothetical protein